MKVDTMERWLFTFLLGTLLSLFLPIVPTVFYVFLFLSFALLVLLHKNYRCYSGFFIGIGWIIFHGVSYINVWQDNKLNRETIHLHSHHVVGEVISIPSLKDNTLRFNFRITAWNTHDLVTPIDVRLSSKHIKHNVKQGQTWLFEVKLKPAYGFANKGGFQYQTWLRAKGIIATGYIVNSATTKLLNSELSIRQRLIDALQAKIPQLPLSPLFYALAFGERSQITTSQWQVLRNTGTQHLIAISGLHLGLIASFCYLFIVWAFRLLPSKMLSVFTTKFNSSTSIFSSSNVPIIALCISGSFALYYAYISGFAIPTVRALLMLLLLVVVKLFDIRMTMIRWLLTVVFIIILLTPLSILSASFWLSLYAVCLIFFIFWRFSPWLFRGIKLIKYVKVLILMQLYLTVAMFPIVGLLNQQLSIVSFIANVIAVPWMSFTSIPLSMLSIVVMPFSESLSSLLIDLALMSLEVVWVWLEYLSEQQWAVVKLSGLENLFILVIVVCLLILTTRVNYVRTTIFTCISIIGLCFLILGRTSIPWKINVMDVGHGLSVIIEKDTKTFIYDTGASYPSGFNIAEAVILPYLNYQGTSFVDMLVISHEDNDHAGGMGYLVDNLVVSEIIKSGAKSNLASSCIQGHHKKWQGLTVEILWPNVDSLLTQQLSDNDSSCVMRISDGNFSLLLTGDISKSVEKKLVASIDIRADILIAPHHGSKTSSSQSFINAVAPQYVVFSTGFLNRWNMPNQSVIARYQKSNVKIYNTAYDGMVQFDVLSNNILVNSYRKGHWPFWFAN